ncbi:MAG: PilZ domain-containing protein [Candidatus Omnitrophota bacterium]
MENNSNKRKASRFGCAVPVDGKDGAVFALAKTVDISRNGIGFISQHNVALNEKFAVELVLKADTEPVLVIGEVKWVRKIPGSERYRVGLSFSEVIDGAQKDIDSVIDTPFLQGEMAP